MVLVDEEKKGGEEQDWVEGEMRRQGKESDGGEEGACSRK